VIGWRELDSRPAHPSNLAAEVSHSVAKNLRLAGGEMTSLTAFILGKAIQSLFQK